jgi:hypothetical protein
MKKLIAVFIVVTGFALNASSQTKKIAQFSHSGKSSAFKPDGEDNFGTRPVTSKEKVATDSNTKKKELSDSFHTAIQKRRNSQNLKSCPRCTQKEKEKQNAKKKKAGSGN